MAKLGLFTASDKKGGAHLAPREKKLSVPESEPQGKANAENAEELSQLKDKSNTHIRTDKFKAFLKKLLSPKKTGKKYRQKKLTTNETLVKVAKLIAMVLFCFFMISPLNSCVFSGKDLVSTVEAEKTAIADSGVEKKDIKAKSSDMIKLDGQECYKIEFESEKNGYRYIINAKTGEIVAQAFYKIEK